MCQSPAVAPEVNARSTAGWIVATTLWFLCACAGSGALSLYSGQAGALGRQPDDWPLGAVPAATSGATRVLVFLHPHCPCAQATLAELERALTTSRVSLDCRLLFTVPPGAAPDWEQGRLLDAARQLAPAQVLLDREGALARRFGVETSGHVLVYRDDGRLALSGGITALRGHQGANPGAAALAALLSGAEPQRATAPVFGCPLFDTPLADAEGAP